MKKALFQLGFTQKIILGTPQFIYMYELPQKALKPLRITTNVTERDMVELGAILMNQHNVLVGGRTDLSELCGIDLYCPAFPAEVPFVVVGWYSGKVPSDSPMLSGKKLGDEYTIGITIAAEAER